MIGKHLNFTSDEEKNKYLNTIIGFFRDDRDEEIGILAAQEISDFFVELIGEEISKKVIQDCKKLLKEKVSDLEIELDSL